ncbi:MAG: S-layer homology domain-containing protein [Chloroflexia bacterium]
MHAQNLPRAHRLTLRLFAACLLGLILLAGVGHTNNAAAAPNDSITVSAPSTTAESDDYATQVLGNPWDMNDPADTDFLYHLAPPTYSNGIWSSTATVANSSVFLQEQDFDSTTNYIGDRNDGVNYPMVSSRFSHLRVRMYSSVNDYAVIFYFPNFSPTPGGNSNVIPTQAGWHIYDFDLNGTGGGGSGTWFNGNWAGLRLDPVHVSGATIQFDWARLTPATTAATTISWSGNGSGTVSLYLATSPNGPNEALIASGLPAEGSYNWTGAWMAPGTYYIRAVLSNATGSSGPMSVNQAPVLNINSPSPSSGEDYAAANLFHTWDLTSLSQLQTWYNVTGFIFGPGYMQASATTGDSQLWLLNGSTSATIDTSRYHYFSYNLFIARPPNPLNGQYSFWNAGPRAIWSPTTAPLNWQSTKAFVAWYDRPLHVAMDLRNPQNLEPGSNVGWTGNPTIFRFDPHEGDDAGLPPYFRIGQMRLTADTTVPNGGSTTISWTPMKTAGTVTLKYSTNPAGGGTTFATVPAADGGYIWAVNNVPNGTYWITAVANDGINAFSQVSLAPIIVTGGHPCPATFSDEPQSETFYTYVSYLYCRGIVEGYSDNTFRPNTYALRGTLASWVVRARGWAINTAGGPHFADVPPSDPLYAYIETAYNHGVISGYSDGTFKPNNSVTRGQMSKMIVIAMGWPIDTTGGPHFSDVTPANTFYQDIETIYNHHTVNGYNDGTFRWGNSLTRGQLSKVLDLSIAP